MHCIPNTCNLAFESIKSVTQNDIHVCKKKSVLMVSLHTTWLWFLLYIYNLNFPAPHFCQRICVVSILAISISCTLRLYLHQTLNDDRC